MKTPTERLLDLAFAIVKPRGKQTVHAWAEANAYLSERVTESAGRYRTTDHPYCAEVLNEFANPKTKKINLCWGSQTGKTTTIYVGIGWAICEAPAPVLWVWSNEKQARNFANDRFLPFCEDTLPLARHLPKTLDGKVDRDRASALRVEFDRCTLNFIGGQSQRNVRNYPVSYLVLDEIDIIPAAIRADVYDRIKGRRSYKVIQSSTPIEEGGIWAQYLQGDQRKFMLPCPRCRRRIPLEWRKGKGEYNLDFPPEAKLEGGGYDWHLLKAATVYRCQKCNGKITDADKLRMLRRGKWKATATGEPGVVSFHLSSLYSPTITFGEMLTRWFRANDSIDGLRQFVTGWLAEPWRDDILDVTEEATHELAGDYERGEIMGDFRLMSVDVQRAHFVWIVRGFDKDGASYLVDHGNAPAWSDLDTAFLNYDCAAAVVDTGFGERTQECYEQIHRRRNKFWASKGWRRLATPVSIKSVDPFTGTGKAARARIRLLHVDVSAFGGEILKRRAGLVEGFELYRNPDRDYVRQFNAKFIIEKTNRAGEVVQEWRTRRHGQDHYFDCEVYCLALSKVLGLGNVANAKNERPKTERTRNGNRTPAGSSHRKKGRRENKRAGNLW